MPAKASIHDRLNITGQFKAREDGWYEVLRQALLYDISPYTILYCKDNDSRLRVIAKTTDKKYPCPLPFSFAQGVFIKAEESH
jgi:hypothetical protein